MRRALLPLCRLACFSDLSRHKCVTLAQYSQSGASSDLLAIRLGPSAGNEEAPSSERHQEPLQKKLAAERAVVQKQEAALASNPIPTDAAVPDAEPVPQAAQPQPQLAAQPGILSETRFDALDLSSGIRRAVADMRHTHLTHVQQASIPPLMQGKDLLGAARTGALTCCLVGPTLFVAKACALLAMQGSCMLHRACAVTV